MGQCEAVSYNPVKLCNYYQRGTSILHNRDKKFYEDKFFLTHERYEYLKKKFPNMLRNELYMMVVIMDAYPHMDKGSQQEKLAEQLMKQFPTSHAKHFPPRYKKRYRYYVSARRCIVIFIRKKATKNRTNPISERAEMGFFMHISHKICMNFGHVFHYVFICRE